MIYSLSIQWPRKHYIALGVFACGYVALAFAGLQNYIRPFSAQFVLGLIATLTSLTHVVQNKHSVRLALITLLFVVLYIVLPAKTVLFAAIGVGALSLASAFSFGPSSITVISLLVVSPIFDYAAGVFSFPLRLWLTSVAARIIHLIRPGTTAEGNVIVSGASEFSVDPACLGLHMLVASLLAGLIMLCHFMKSRKRTISFAGILIFLVTVIILNVISNLVRIVCLVHFKILPGSWLHDAMGLVCFGTYVILPMLFIIPFYLKLSGKVGDSSQFLSGFVPSRFNLLLNGFLLTTIAFSIVYNNSRSLNTSVIEAKEISLPGYNATLLDDRVTKLSNKDGLIYVKPIAGFYSSDHQPMLCWAGSGYEFTRVQEQVIDNRNVYTAVLEKNTERLYTAWWYDNGVTSTISQFEWRWNALRNNNQYSIVNVTAATPDALRKETAKLLSLHLGKR